MDRMTSSVPEQQSENNKTWIYLRDSKPATSRNEVFHVESTLCCAQFGLKTKHQTTTFRQCRVQVEKHFEIPHFEVDAKSILYPRNMHCEKNPSPEVAGAHKPNTQLKMLVVLVLHL